VQATKTWTSSKTSKEHARPSQTDNIMTAKMIIDATKPVQRPYEARVAVPKTAMEKTRLEDFIPRGVIDRVPKV
jgi:hypothetical protein